MDIFRSKPYLVLDLNGIPGRTFGIGLCHVTLIVNTGRSVDTFVARHNGESLAAMDVKSWRGMHSTEGIGTVGSTGEGRES